MSVLRGSRSAPQLTDSGYVQWLSHASQSEVRPSNNNQTWSATKAPNKSEIEISGAFTRRPGKQLAGSLIAAKRDSGKPKTKATQDMQPPHVDQAIGNTKRQTLSENIKHSSKSDSAELAEAKHYLRTLPSPSTQTGKGDSSDSIDVADLMRKCAEHTGGLSKEGIIGAVTGSVGAAMGALGAAAALSQFCTRRSARDKRQGAIELQDLQKEHQKVVDGLGNAIMELIKQSEDQTKAMKAQSKRSEDLKQLDLDVDIAQLLSGPDGDPSKQSTDMERLIEGNKRHAKDLRAWSRHFEQFREEHESQHSERSLGLDARESLLDRREEEFNIKRTNCRSEMVKQEIRANKARYAAIVMDLTKTFRIEEDRAIMAETVRDRVRIACKAQQQSVDRQLETLAKQEKDLENRMIKIETDENALKEKKAISTNNDVALSNKLFELERCRSVLEKIQTHLDSREQALYRREIGLSAEEARQKDVAGQLEKISSKQEAIRESFRKWKGALGMKEQKLASSQADLVEQEERLSRLSQEMEEWMKTLEGQKRGN